MTPPEVLDLSITPYRSPYIMYHRSVHSLFDVVGTEDLHNNVVTGYKFVEQTQNGRHMVTQQRPAVAVTSDSNT